MAQNPLHQLEACGVSVWNDNILRSWVKNGDLQRLIEEDGLTGVTSNPTIFDKAISESPDYDDQLKSLADQNLSPEDIFKRIAVTDIGMAADVLRPVYDRTNGRDGFVSIEVSPQAAHDTAKTLQDAHYFWNALQRPNIMIKVPATPEGIPAIEELIAAGINVNITLIFAVDVHKDVMEAYIKGLETRVQRGQPVDRIASVASFFVSRVDTLVDSLLDEKAKDSAANHDAINALKGKVAVANARIAYQHFQDVFGSDRFKALQAKGAGVQRPLWASTSTKNPEYRDTIYVEDLVGRDTVNTMPPQTIIAVRDHGKIECDTVTQDVDGAYRVIEGLKAVGIDINDVTDELTRDGVDKFCQSLNELFSTIADKTQKIEAGSARQ